MDKDTIEAYSRDAEGYLKRYSELRPFRMVELIDAFFVKEAESIDIGCASGRDIEILNSKGHKVTGVDVVPEFVDFCKNKFPDIKFFTNSNDFFNDKNIDAVLIATPHTTHVPLGIQSLKSGKHTLVEKPLTVTTKKCLELINIANSCNVSF